ncbi:Dynein light chain [Vigna unguiculata]|uniref:Dynein light chain n=1 Tax=Vigna unguiculata TaxID=3917 RepID=A0A4D6LAA3_VIGUN|nr:Dynein light chain [Vigna unguiculata]
MAEEELERRSNFLKGLIQKKKAIEQQEQHDHLQHNNVRVRASDMPLPLQNAAFRCARHLLDSMPPKKLDSKRLALALKKVTFLLVTVSVHFFTRSVSDSDLFPHTWCEISMANLEAFQI